jgi:hypothetical protein
MKEPPMSFLPAAVMNITAISIYFTAELIAALWQPKSIKRNLLIVCWAAESIRSLKAYA